MLQGALDQCEQECLAVLHTNEADKSAAEAVPALTVPLTVPSAAQPVQMMADILFRKGEIEQAARLLEGILSTSPAGQCLFVCYEQQAANCSSLAVSGNFETLAQLLDLMRRTGQLSKCQQYLSPVTTFLSACDYHSQVFGFVSRLVPMLPTVCMSLA